MKLIDEIASSLPSIGSFAAMGSLCLPAVRYTYNPTRPK